MIITFIICFIAGIGAGLGTGFAGMSAAAVISPILITCLNMPAYDAVGIALASDVLASAVSAYTYKKNKNLDVKNGLVMMGTILIKLTFLVKIPILHNLSNSLHHQINHLPLFFPLRCSNKGKFLLKTKIWRWRLSSSMEIRFMEKHLYGCWCQKRE